MGELRCVDGSVLSVEAVTCRDQAGRPYEITLSLTRNSVPFAAVGQRCGYQLAQLARQVSAARADPALAAAWPDPDDRFPAAPADPAGTGAPGCLDGDREFFALRSRDRADLPGTGELRCIVRSRAQWLGGHIHIGQHMPPRERAGRAPGGRAGWRLTRRAVIEAWGAGGVGVRAVLTSAELMAFLDTVVTGLAAAAEIPQARRAARAGRAAAARAQHGRVPDGTADTDLPAV